jgi:hypothetical protein
LFDHETFLKLNAEDFDKVVLENEPGPNIEGHFIVEENVDNLFLLVACELDNFTFLFGNLALEFLKEFAHNNLGILIVLGLINLQ